MTSEQKERLWKKCKPILFLGILGILYYMWLRLTGIGIPCMFKTITGLDCPGCGVTRMAEAVLRLDFKSAFHYNCVLMVVLPVFGGIYTFEAVRYIKSGNTKNTAFSKAVLVLCCIALIVYGIVRNL